jgi:anti-sigma-K factor RskA
MTDADLHLLTGAYAADALSADERRAFEDHLPGCASCSHEVRELQATAALLGAAVAEVPPPSLKAAVLAEARTSPQAVSLDAARTRRLGRLATVLGAVAAVLAIAVIGLGAWAVSLHRTNEQVVAQAAAVTQVLTAPDAASTSGRIAGGGRGTVVVSRAQDSAVFVASDLAPAASGSTYQLWWIDKAGAARSAGLVAPTSDGSVATLLAGAPGDAADVGVTVEPAGGSAEPTTKPVLVVPVTA